MKNTELQRRYEDKHVLEKLMPQIIVGIVSAVFTAYVATERLSVELEHVKDDISNISTAVDKIHTLGERVAVLESRE